MARKTTGRQAATDAISVKVPPDLLKKVREKSAETGVPISFVVRKALEEWVVDEGKKR